MTLVWVTVAAVALAAALLLHAHAGYSVALLALGSSRPRPKGSSGDAARPPKIGVVIVAHDESAVITAAVEAWVAQAYATDRFEVFVVADHCTDDTAALAEAAGATVLERNTGRAEGKAPALAYGVDAVAERGFDAVTVADADNIPVEGFLAAAARRLSDDAVVQGLVDAKNAGRSWVAGTSALGFWAMAAMSQGPRERLGLSTPMMGTAWTARIDVCAPLVARLESLTDDLELGALLALDGVRVAYEPDARVYDEKPPGLGTAVTQRHRWMQGRWSVAERFMPKLVAKALGASGGTFGERLRALDSAWWLVSPSLLFTSVALALVGAAQLAIVALAPTDLPSWTSVVPPRGTLIAAAGYYLIPALAMLRLVSPARVWLLYLAQPLYLVWSLPLAISGFLLRGRRAWKRTEHGAEPR